MTFIILPVKFSGSTIPVECDFSSLMATGEAVTAVVTTAQVFTGTDPSPSSIISGTGTLVRNSFVQKITGGLVGVVYLLTFSATTNLLNYRIINAYLAVINDDPFLVP